MRLHRPTLRTRAQRLVLTGLGCIAAAATAHSDVWFVDLTNPTEGDGTSWSEAFQSLPPAIAAAASASDPNPEIWVTEHTYPAGPGTHIDLVGSAFANVTIRGGFVGTETTAEERPAPAALPPIAIADGTLFEASLVNNGRFLRTDVDVTLDRLHMRYFATEDSGGVLELLGASASLTGVMVSNTSAQSAGGAIYAAPGSALTIENCHFVSVTTDSGRGGAIYMLSEGQLTATDSYFRNGESYEGAGIYLGNLCAATITHSEFSGNLATAGGAIAIFAAVGVAQPLVTISGCRFIRDKQNALYFRSANVRFEDNTVADCSVQQFGTSPVIVIGSIFEAIDSRFDGNRSDSGSGGAVAIGSEGALSNAPAVFRRCAFRSNYSKTTGGAIRSLSQNLIVDSCHFEGNIAEREGGAISLTDSIPDPTEIAVIRDSYFIGNKAGNAGGAIRARRPLDIQRTTFLRNYAAFGGAVETHITGRINLVNCVLAFNGSTAVYVPVTTGDSSIVNCTFYENTSEDLLAGAFYFHNGSGFSQRIANNIFIQSTGAVALFEDGFEGVAHDNLVNPGNLQVELEAFEGEVAFLDPQRGDFRITDPTDVEDRAITDVPATDLRHADRPQGSGSEIGAYEYTPGEDRDGDGLTDIEEGNGDSDNDGIPDYLDNDNLAGPIQTDINRDGTLDAADLQTLINAILGI